MKYRTYGSTWVNFGDSMKYKQVTIIILLILGVLLNFFPIQGNLTNLNLFSRWKIHEWNDDIAVAWDWPTTYFEATSGSHINYTIDHYDSSNFTHPSAGTIEIGNLTTQTSNNKTGEVLVLSIYGWFPGLVTSSRDWTLQQQVAETAAQGQWTMGSLVTSDVNYHYAGTLRQAINFTYRQDPNSGNQNTTLIYDKETGVLLEGFTEVQFASYYVLSLKLVYSDLIPNETTTNNETAWIFIPILIATLVMGLAWKAIRNKR